MTGRSHPRAASVHVGTCGQCESIHIELRNDKDEIIADALIDTKDALPMAAKLLETADYIDENGEVVGHA